MNHKFVNNHFSINITKRLVLEIGIKSRLKIKRLIVGFSTLLSSNSYNRVAHINTEFLLLFNFAILISFKLPVR